jgi:hypothetical protein
MKLEIFMGCWESSIACTDNGRIVHLHGKVCTKSIIDIAVWYLQRILARFSVLARFV